MAESDASATGNDDAQYFQVLLVVGLLLLGAVFWHNVHLMSRFTTIFVDRASAVEACLTASTMTNSLTAIPSYRIGSVQTFSPEYYEQRNSINSARAARNAELRERTIGMRVAAERSRDLELANARDVEQVLEVCRQKRYLGTR